MENHAVELFESSQKAAHNHHGICQEHYHIAPQQEHTEYGAAKARLMQVTDGGDMALPASAGPVALMADRLTSGVGTYQFEGKAGYSVTFPGTCPREGCGSNQEGWVMLYLVFNLAMDDFMPWMQADRPWSDGLGHRVIQIGAYPKMPMAEEG